MAQVNEGFEPDTSVIERVTSPTSEDRKSAAEETPRTSGDGTPRTSEDGARNQQPSGAESRIPTPSEDGRGNQRPTGDDARTPGAAPATPRDVTPPSPGDSGAADSPPAPSDESADSLSVLHPAPGSPPMYNRPLEPTVTMTTSSQLPQYCDVAMETVQPGAPGPDGPAAPGEAPPSYESIFGRARSGSLTSSKTEFKAQLRKRCMLLGCLVLMIIIPAVVYAIMSTNKEFFDTLNGRRNNTRTTSTATQGSWWWGG